ncbi:hypothetical protein VM1G_03849 [Cytospora mali]|uniref:Tafazzin n=1 Tax=Cytospora mali TaxID=578113 RepID=A0A194VWH8_CYTMA|nr:hypothetical protein VM1G_03849 [Valsa mali]
MPKKRHQNKYSKPQSTAPASLAGSSSPAAGRNRDGDHDRPSVNQLLASLRRTRLNGGDQQASASVAEIGAPSVPPQIRQILSLPETPAPPPRRRARFVPRLDAQGRRLPAGPPPPHSWLSRSRHAPRLDFGSSAVADFEGRLLPGLYRPGEQSLMDIVIRKMVLDWEYQRSYNIYYLYSLPDRVRMALISYLSTVYEPGLSLSDLKLIILPQLPDDGDVQGYEAEPLPSPSTLNEGITHLDLSTSVGRSIKLRELSSLLFPAQSDTAGPLLESWDIAEAILIPRPLLPNLTHLSLAANPETSSLVSWKQLLSFSTRLPTLTHLSLAYWPVPSLTPNATFAKVVTTQGQAVQYGGTNPYSHSLDGDWSEAILILRKLSQNLYGLEYLDLTGCAPWFGALTASVGLENGQRDKVDWVGDWGKVEHLVLTTGYALPTKDEAGKVEKHREVINTVRGVERAIRTRRAGKGRFITVETDKGLDED